MIDHVVIFFSLYLIFRFFTCNVIGAGVCPVSITVSNITICWFRSWKFIKVDVQDSFLSKLSTLAQEIFLTFRTPFSKEMLIFRACSTLGRVEHSKSTPLLFSETPNHGRVKQQTILQSPAQWPGLWMAARLDTDLTAFFMYTWYTAVSRKVVQQNRARQCRKALWVMGVHDAWLRL